MDNGKNARRGEKKEHYVLIPSYILFTIIASLTSAAVFSQESQSVPSMAEDICDCVADPYANMEKLIGDIAVAQAHGEYETLVQKREDILDTIEDAATCFESTAANYPDINQNADLQTQVLALTESQCPNPADHFTF